MEEHRFQIHLGGIIDLLSNHLYSSPSVYLRELLQNATDALRARALHEGTPEVRGAVRLTVAHGARPQLTIEDDGIGLTEDEVHRFLATIGASSKREELEARRRDFIGQFGIGLLSAFVVSDTISVVTRSAKGGPAIAWQGRADGTYSIERLEDGGQDGPGGGAPVGTTVHLVAKDEMAEWFDPEKVEELATRFGGLLPFPVELVGDAGARRLNPTPPPWRRHFDSPAEARDAALHFGEALLEQKGFFDVLPLKSVAGGVEGLAYVLPFSPPPTAPPAHRVYLKGMLLTEHAENLLPRWAFFVTCILDVQDLRPTASRESFYEDGALAAARDALGEALRAYLMRLREEDPRRLELLIALHYRAIKALAAQDDDLLRLFLDLLPFETSMGRMSFGALRRRSKRIQFAGTVDLFRQMAPIAAAQGLGIVNAGYSYDADLLRRAPEVFPDLEVQEVDAADLTESLADVVHPGAFEQLLAVAARTLAPYGCEVALKRFAPAELPVLYVASDDARFQRDVDTAKEATGDGLWGGMLDAIDEGPRAKAQVVFNADNPLVVRLAHMGDEEALTKSVPMLYVQALLLGHHPLSADEMALLNVGLLDLIEWGLGGGGSPTLQ